MFPPWEKKGPALELEMAALHCSLRGAVGSSDLTEACLPLPPCGLDLLVQSHGSPCGAAPRSGAFTYFSPGAF